MTMPFEPLRSLNAATRAQSSDFGLASPDPVRSAINAFLSRRSPRTRHAYERDLADFAQFFGTQDKGTALSRLVSLPHGSANAVAYEYKSGMVKRGLSSATVNRRLSTLRSAVKLANVLGLVNWTLSVENEKSQKYRDTRGTGTIGFQSLVQAAEAKDTPKAIRDVAILRLLYDMALRRGEISSLDVSDFDREGRTLSVRGKGREHPEKLSLPSQTFKALVNWLDARRSGSQALFTNFDRAGKGGRLTPAAIYYIVSRIGKQVGIVARPHGLRHAAITAALDLTNGNVRLVKEFSRHANVQTVMIYDDRRNDCRGEIAKLVAAQVGQESDWSTCLCLV